MVARCGVGVLVYGGFEEEFEFGGHGGERMNCWGKCFVGVSYGDRW